MTARKPLYVTVASGGVDVGVTPAEDARLAQGQLLSALGPGALDGGAGIIYGPGNPCNVTGNSAGPSIQYDIAAGGLVTQRGSSAQGRYLWVNDGTFTVDSGAIAPGSGSGSRYDLIWARAKNGSTTGPDADSNTEFGVTVGGANTGTPTKPYSSVPAGALVLAESLVGNQIASGAAATITMVAPYKVARGAAIPVRNQTERDALTGYAGLKVTRLDKAGIEQVHNGGTTGTVWETPAGPAIYGTKTANGNVTSNQSTDVTWDTYKTRRGASGGAITFTPGLAGVYEIDGYITWTPGNSGVRAVQAIVDGNATPASRVDDDGTMNSSGASIDYTFTMPVVVPSDTSTVKLQVSYYGSTPATLQILSGSTFSMKFVCDL